MNKDRFNRMMEGIRQGADYLHGLTEPSRVFEVSVLVPDPKAVRGELNVSQGELAAMLGIRVRTLQDWERKGRVPHGPARILLALAATYPDQVREVSRQLADQQAVES